MGNVFDEKLSLWDTLVSSLGINWFQSLNLAAQSDLAETWERFLKVYNG
jgi:hypothetical protein